MADVHRPRYRRGRDVAPWWRDPGAVVQGLDPDDLATRLRRVGDERWWLRPVSFVGVALLGLAGAVATRRPLRRRPPGRRRRR